MVQLLTPFLLFYLLAQVLGPTLLPILIYGPPLLLLKVELLQIILSHRIVQIDVGSWLFARGNERRRYGPLRRIGLAASLRGPGYKWQL